MKKENQKSKKNSTPKNKESAPKTKKAPDTERNSVPEKQVIKKPPRSVPKKGGEKKGGGGFSPMSFLSRASHFLREAKTELKKVKWPTRKELLASTAVVIVLVILVSFFLGLVDLGLIKIIKHIMG